MPRTEKVYRRLPGRTSGFLTYSRLWLGPDHLLLARTAFFSEEYRRFYFRDIQAIVVRENKRHVFWGWVFGILFGVFSVVLVLGFFESSGGSFQSSDPVGFIVWGVPALACLVLLYFNYVFGPGCICHVRTAVQTEELSPLRRFRTARKAIERLRPNIEQAQGPLAPELLRPKPAALAGPAAAATPEQPASQANQPSPTTSS